MSFLVDLCATLSIVGIWPRFIEPHLLKTTHLTWTLPSQNHLWGLKIVHISDLHFHAGIAQRFLDKIIQQVRSIRPDILVFTGDFLCYARLEAPEQLLSFLNALKAPLGCYCIFGNHDYAHYVSLNRMGIYDLIPPPSPISGLLRGLRTLFSNPKASTNASEKAKATPLHEELCNLLRSTPFQLLENRTTTLPIGLNITGLGDLGLGRCIPQKAFENYNKAFPGLILSHNPDSIPRLLDCPGDWILSGHTHGEQIHLPWPKWGRKLTQKLTRIENKEYTRGLFSIRNKKVYVNRGLGSHKPFRFFSPPEICVINIKS
jgi:predicted MPP superfamily phosphohydrolase